MSRGAGGGLAGVHPGLGAEGVHGAGDAGEQAAAAPRDDDGVDVVEVLDQLQPDGGGSKGSVVVASFDVAPT